MEARLFDTVVKALGSDTTRRGVLRRVLATAGGGVLVHLAERRIPAAGKCCAEERKRDRAFCEQQGGKGCRLDPASFNCVEQSPGVCPSEFLCTGNDNPNCR
jgi:hypothetical protein